MADKTIGNMAEGEFGALIEQFIVRGEDEVTLTAFLQVMTDIAEQRKQREVELTSARRHIADQMQREDHRSQ